MGWSVFLQQCRHRELIEVLLANHHVRLKDLKEWARAHPQDAVQSAVLDVFAARGVMPDAVKLWPEIVRLPGRPANLLTRSQLLICCYATIPGLKGDELMSSLLSQSPPDKGPLFALLLERHELAVRLTDYLASVSGFAESGAGKHGARAFGLLMQWLRKAEDELNRGPGPRFEAASIVVGQVRFMSMSRSFPAAPSLAQLVLLATVTTEKVAMQSLQHAEAKSQGPQSPLLVLRGDELHQLLQQYIGQLRTTSNPNAQPANRAERFAQYQGSRLVLHQIVQTLEDPTSDSHLRDSLEVILFNCDVRQLGNVGDRVAFDVRIHEAQEAGIIPGDRVVVMRPGRRLGETDDSPVLLRAKVKAVEQGKEHEEGPVS